MPALKTLLEKLDELPEALHEYYTEKDGKFILDVDGIDDHPSVRALKNALESQKDARRKAADEITKLKERLAKIPEDFDPEEVTRLRAQIEEYEADPSKKDKTGQEALVAARKQLEQKIANMEKEHAKTIEGLNKKIASKDTFISQLLIDEGLTKALVEANVGKDFMKAAKAMLRQNVKVVEEDDGEYKAIIDTDVGVVGIDKYVSDWAASDEGKPFIPPAKGGDAGGPAKPKRGSVDTSGIKNPWAKEHWNLTEQGRLLKADRVKADQLAKAAGHKIPDAA